MKDFLKDGTELRLQIKDLVFSYMKSKQECSVYSKGMKQAEIFRECGLDWGTHENATSSQQVFWIVGLLRELERENKIQRIEKLWKLK
jgi:hypothetical protein